MKYSNKIVLQYFHSLQKSFQQHIWYCTTQNFPLEILEKDERETPFDSLLLAMDSKRLVIPSSHPIIFWNTSICYIGDIGVIEITTATSRLQNPKEESDVGKGLLVPKSETDWSGHHKTEYANEPAQNQWYATGWALTPKLKFPKGLSKLKSIRTRPWK